MTVKEKQSTCQSLRLFQLIINDVKSVCSMEQGVSIAYRTICKCFGDPKPNYLMPSFIYTIPPLLLIGQTRTPADNMFICRVVVPPTLKFAIDTPPRGVLLYASSLLESNYLY